MIRRRQVGLVLVRDVSRLGRDLAELATFFGEAAERGVVVLAAEFVVHDLTAWWQPSVIDGKQLPAGVSRTVVKRVEGEA